MNLTTKQRREKKRAKAARKKMLEQKLRQQKQQAPENNTPQQQLKSDSAQWPKELTRINDCYLPPHQKNLVSVWRSSAFLVQVFNEGVHGEFGRVLRITVNRTAIDSSGAWIEGITWDELQKIKRDVGYGSCWGIEWFPPDADVVNVSNMRHLWVAENMPVKFNWVTKEKINDNTPNIPESNRCRGDGPNNPPAERD